MKSIYLALLLATMQCYALRVRSIHVGTNHSCALMENSRVKCWGWNAYGQLGLGALENLGSGFFQMGDALPYVDLGTGKLSTVLEMSAGYNHNCALLADHRVKCWGNNDYGQLGLGGHNARGDEPFEMGEFLPAVDLGKGKRAVQIVSGVDSNCALLEDGGVKCWGGAQSADGALGDQISEMGDNLPYVDLGGGKITALAAGGHHTCAIFEDGRLKCWGENYSGQLGLGDTDPRNPWDPEVMGKNLKPVDLGTGVRVVSVSLGSYMTCAIVESDKGERHAKCWGENYYGNLGQGDKLARGNAPGQMGDALLNIELGTGGSVVQIAAGNNDACALLSDGQIKCWGYNAEGFQGTGDRLTRGGAPGEMGDALPNLLLPVRMKDLSQRAAGTHTCAISESDEVYCWGSNYYGELGMEDTLNRGPVPEAMGSALRPVNLGN